jgi:hypothetical protein
VKLFSFFIFTIGSFIIWDKFKNTASFMFLIGTFILSLMSFLMPLAIKLNINIPISHIFNFVYTFGVLIQAFGLLIFAKNINNLEKA